MHFLIKNTVDGYWDNRRYSRSRQTPQKRGCCAVRSNFRAPNMRETFPRRRCPSRGAKCAGEEVSQQIFSWPADYASCLLFRTAPPIPQLYKGIHSVSGALNLVRGREAEILQIRVVHLLEVVRNTTKPLFSIFVGIDLLDLFRENDKHSKRLRLAQKQAL